MFKHHYWTGLMLCVVTAASGSDFAYRHEWMSQFVASDHARASSRQLIGGEILKKFSTPTATVASLNVQIRLVRRDRYIHVQNDMEGEDRRGWWLEYHNAYLDVYNIGPHIGHLNWRAGRFYVPFGLNLQTDTHGQILQLSNDENFGFERDWYSGLWGSINDHVNYDLNYLVGSGYHPRFDGQKGLGALRLSLANRYSYEYGLEGGLSALGGERLTKDRTKVDTSRFGLDSRLRRAIPTGSFTMTGEWSCGQDDSTSVFTQLYQGEYLHHSRRWGLASQYRRFWNELQMTKASVLGEVSWYFRNGVSNSNLHWIKANVEKQTESPMSRRDIIYSLQYYRYW